MSRCTCGTCARSWPTPAISASRPCAASATGCAARSPARPSPGPESTRAPALRLLRALRSLRWRLTLTFVALVALLLAGLGVYQYETLQRSLVDSRVGALRGDLDGAQPLLARTLAPARTAPAGGTTAAQRALAGVVRAVQSLCLNDPGAGSPLATRAALLSQALACSVSDASGHTVSVVVYDRQLNPVAHAGGRPAGDIPRLDPGALQVAAQGRQSNATVLDATEGPQLTVAFPVTSRLLAGPAAAAAGTGGAVRAIAQLSTSTASIDGVLAAERTRLAFGDGAVLLAALLAGLLLTGRALAPMQRLTQTAGRLAGGDLRARSRLTPRGDEVGALAAAFDDMADRIETAFAAQAEQEARMRRFVADASHELRTPVTALKGYIDVIRRGAVTDPASLDAALETMGREADRMRVLVLDLLTLARLDAQRPLIVEPIDLNEVVDAVLDEGVPGMPETVERSLAEGPVQVMADRNALTTVLRNLLTNACKYAPGAPQHWSTERRDGRGLVRARDEGPGIPAGDLPHLFERFYRGEKTRAREEGGSGLGLSIVHGLTRAMGGDAGIASREGEGTTVSIWLPAVTRPAPR